MVPPLADRASPKLLLRRREQRWIAGVAGGIADYLGVPVGLVRVALVVLTPISGMGAVLYVAAVILAPLAPPGPDGASVTGGLHQVEELRVRALHALDGVRGQAGQARSDLLDGAPQRSFEALVGLVLLLVGTVLVVRNLAGGWRDDIAWPLLLAGVGIAVVWARTDATERRRVAEAASRLPGRPWESLRSGPYGVIRLVLGGSLILTGLMVWLAANDALRITRSAVVAGLATAAGLVLTLAPWIRRLLQDLGEERAERIRADERATVAAHLHDSVLQTLALIQRSAERPAETVALARRQERELRSWLYGGGEVGSRPRTLEAAAAHVAAEVEAMGPVAIDVVVVGDAPVDDRVDALLGAAREALVNVVKHAGVSSASLFVEVGPTGIEAFVRDRGRGFDPATVKGDRAGIARSIEDRLERVGGTATVVSAPGEGTEVTLELPNR